MKWVIETYSRDVGLCKAIQNTSIDRRMSISNKRTSSSFTSLVHVDCEELVFSINRLPRSSQRLTTRGECLSQWIESSRIVLELRTRQDFVCLCSVARAGVVKTDEIRLVEICLTIFPKTQCDLCC